MGEFAVDVGMGQNTAVQYISTKSFTVAVNSAKGDFSKVYMVQIKPYSYKWPVSRNDIWCPPYIYIYLAICLETSKLILL